MAQEIQKLVCLDTSVLIDYFRKSKKEKTFFARLVDGEFQGFSISVVVHFEIYQDINKIQLNYWNNLLQDFFLIPYTERINNYSIEIFNQLKKKRKSIEFKDLMIAATAKANNYVLATLNKKHFDNIEGLELITPDVL